MQLHKVAIGYEMLRSNLLAIENVGAPHACELQVLGNVFVQEHATG